VSNEVEYLLQKKNITKWPLYTWWRSLPRERRESPGVAMEKSSSVPGVFRKSVLRSVSRIEWTFLFTP
jgi:hypothetical protein